VGTVETNQAAGPGGIRINGKTLACTGVEFQGPGHDREDIMAGTATGFRVVGFKRTASEGGVAKCKAIFVQGGWTAAQLNALQDATIEVDLGNGETHTGEGGFLRKRINQSSEEGSADVEFGAMSWDGK